MDFPFLLTTQLREHLRALRKERGLTQAALGQMLGVKQARIAEIESNPGAVSMDQLLKLISALRASLVLRDEGQASPASPAAHKVREPAPPPSVKPRAGARPRKAAATTKSAPASKRDVVIRAKKGSW